MNKPFINFHCHQEQSDHLQIINLDPREELLIIDKPHLFYSLGLHPWWISHPDETKKMIKKIRDHLHHKKIIAIGEAGLDRLIDTDFNNQMDLFAAQFNLAHEFKKPIILHCVRAYSDFLQFFKKNVPKYPVIFHDFNTNDQILSELLRYNCYFSFGSRIIKNKKTQKLLTNVPIDKLLLETDDEKSHCIENIALQASSLKNIKLENILEQLNINFQRLFPNS